MFIQYLPNMAARPQMETTGFFELVGIGYH